MINTNAFDYINVLQKTADAAWIRNDVISNNIANATTPGYKRQDVAFEDELANALGRSRYKSMDDKVADLKINRLRPRTYTDSANFSYRVDGNNVDMDQEQVEIVRTAYQYQYVLNSITNDINRLRSAAKSF